MVAIQWGLLVKFSCDLYIDILLRNLLFVWLLDFVSSSRHNTSSTCFRVLNNNSYIMANVIKIIGLGRCGLELNISKFCTLTVVAITSCNNQ